MIPSSSSALSRRRHLRECGVGDPPVALDDPEDSAIGGGEGARHVGSEIGHLLTIWSEAWPRSSEQ
jgi:hypothetical protein